MMKLMNINLILKLINLKKLFHHSTILAIIIGILKKTILIYLILKISAKK